jgi:5'(3')-deoxyribonucleotidase
MPYARFKGINLKEGNKFSVDMSDGILLDDNIEMLNGSNAKVKLIFGDIYPWNSNNPNMYYRCWNWTEVYNYLME